MGHDIFLLFLFFNLVFPVVKSYWQTDLCSQQHLKRIFSIKYEFGSEASVKKKEQRTDGWPSLWSMSARDTKAHIVVLRSLSSVSKYLMNASAMLNAFCEFVFGRQDLKMPSSHKKQTIENCVNHLIFFALENLCV